jgi:hypothetical protein
MDWPIEPIPNDALVYRHIHRNLFNNGVIGPGAFMFKDAPFSVDWNKYSTPWESQQRANKANENGVIQLEAGKVRTVESLSLVHNPPGNKTPNRAHSLIVGANLAGNDGRFEEVRLKLYRMATIAIPAPSL